MTDYMCKTARTPSKSQKLCLVYLRLLRQRGEVLSLQPSYHLYFSGGTIKVQLGVVLQRINWKSLPIMNGEYRKQEPHCSEHRIELESGSSSPYSFNIRRKTTPFDVSRSSHVIAVAVQRAVLCLLTIYSEKFRASKTL